ncbi:hypothetical protein D3C76_1211640 [compost metagenome]
MFAVFATGEIPNAFAKMFAQGFDETPKMIGDQLTMLRVMRRIIRQGQPTTAFVILHFMTYAN